MKIVKKNFVASPIKMDWLEKCGEMKILTENWKPLTPAEWEKEKTQRNIPFIKVKP